jgi:hypothetical protein
VLRRNRRIRVRLRTAYLSNESARENEARRWARRCGMPSGRSLLTTSMCLATAFANAESKSRREPAVLTVGSTVRVQSSALERRAEGRVESLDETALTVVSEKNGSQRIPWATVSRVDLKVGTRRPVLETVLVGGALGAVIGLIAPLPDACGGVPTAPAPPPPNSETYAGTTNCSRGEQVGTAAAGGAAFGLLGAFIADPGDFPKWKRLAPPYTRPSEGPSVSVRLSPVRGGLSARVALTF